MGLDSVELLHEFENYFNIRIENKDAEAIRTIKDTTNVVARYLNIYDENTNLRDETFAKIQQVFYGAYNIAVTHSDLVSKYLTKENEKWDRLELLSGLKLPRPANIPSEKKDGTFRRFYNSIFQWQSLYDWSTVTFENFTDSVCAANNESLVEAGNWQSKYEVYVCVKSIVARCLGLELYEISPDKSYTDDLGVD